MPLQGRLLLGLWEMMNPLHSTWALHTNALLDCNCVVLEAGRFVQQGNLLEVGEINCILANHIFSAPILVNSCSRIECRV